MEGPTEPIFLPFMCRLRVFEIHINPSSAFMEDFDILSFLIRSLRVSLTTPATLEHLKFSIVFEGNFTDPEDFCYDGFCEDLWSADVWRHLDSFTTHPTCSRLRRVDINIKYAFRDDDHPTHEVIDMTDTDVVVLDALPLLRQKGILFVKATQNADYL